MAGFTYRLDLEYEGTRYSGWQVQANARTVAGELTRALVQAGVQPLELGGAGRTDAGVHAAQQTAHLRLAARVDASALLRSVNESLPADIHLLALRPAAPSFHARHDALARSYVYQLARRRSGLAKRHVWWVKRALEIERLREAAGALAGRHDFRRLCQASSRQSSTLVEVQRVEIAACGDLVLFRLVASHFLWKQVRRTIGALVRVGSGQLSRAAWARLVDPEPDREAAPEEPSPAAEWTAPPSGLFLERVLYPGEAPLAALAPLVPVPAQRELIVRSGFLGAAPRSAPGSGRARRPAGRSALPGRRGR